jgi:hypothetical protein
LFRRAAVLGCLGTLVPVLVVVAGLLVAGDVAARRYAAGQISDRVSAAVPGATGVHSRISSFPFLGRLAFNGVIPEVGTHVDQLNVAAGLSFSNLDVDLRSVHLDRHAMFSNRKVSVRRVGRGTFTVDLTATALTAALGRQVRASGGAILVTVLGNAAVRANVAITASHHVEVRVAGLPVLDVPLPSAKLLPCVPQITVIATGLTLGCTFTNIPPAFVQAVSGGT